MLVQILMIAFKALPPLNMMSETAALEKSIAVSAYEKVCLTSPFCGVVWKCLKDKNSDW